MTAIGVARIAPWVILVIGMAFVCTGVVLDAFVRLRMRDLGYKTVLFRSSVYDYKIPLEYLRVRRQYGWSPFPAYLIWPMIAIGFLVLLYGISKM